MLRHFGLRNCLNAENQHKEAIRVLLDSKSETEDLSFDLHTYMLVMCLVAASIYRKLVLCQVVIE